MQYSFLLIVNTGYSYPRFHGRMEGVYTVSPTQFKINTGVDAYSLTVNPAAGLLYFGFEQFYPGGFKGATDAHREAHEDLMERPGFNYFQHKM